MQTPITIVERRITLTDTVMVTDPCYEIPTWCQIKLSGVLPGAYVPMCLEVDTDGWGTREAVLLAVHEDYIDEALTWRKTAGEVGVDSGQAGIFSYDTYRNDEIVESIPTPTTTYDGGPLFEYPWRDKAGDAWYEKMCRITLAECSWGTYSEGVVSRSGYGDGAYTCLVAKKNKKIVGIAIDFGVIRLANSFLNNIKDDLKFNNA